MKAINNPSVKNAFAAAHADITTGNGYLNIAGCPSVYIPGSTYSILPSIVATPYVIKITPSTTAAQSNSFSITQLNKATGLLQTYLYIGDNIGVGTTAAIEIAKIIAWVKAVNKATGNGSLGATATDQTTYVTIQGTVTDPLFTYTNLGNATIIDTTNAMLLSQTIASNTTASPTVFTASADVTGVLSPGSIVKITTSNVAKFVAGTYRVRATNVGAANTDFTLESVSDGSAIGGTATATGTITLIATEARGQGPQVAAAGTQNEPLVGDTPIPADSYTTVVVNGSAPDSDVLTNKRNTGFSQTYYFDEDGANYAAFLAQLRLELARQSSAGVVDPGLVS